MTSFFIDIDLGQVRQQELIEELEYRSLCLNDNEKQQLLDIVKYDDSEKWKLFLSIKDKYSLLELQELFKEDTHAVNCKEQLAIPFNS